jgi:glycosyltransferase involved in cell wall biosynthesis
LGEVDVIGGHTRTSILMRSLSVIMRAIIPLRTREYDLVFAGFYGHLLLLPLSILCQSPIVFDAYVSTYDTLCFDRKIFSSNSIFGRLAYWLDKQACVRSSRVLLDTQPHLRYFHEVFGLSEALFSVLPVSCNEDIFHPRTDAKIVPNRILFYCTYMPLHGVETILKAFAMLDNTRNLELRMLGDGSGLARAQQITRELNLKNVHFLPYLPLKDLADEISTAGICLGGHFGKTDKADRVVPSKIYQIMAMAKPMVAGDTSANRKLLVHGQSALLCPPADPESLANAIESLNHDPGLREKLSSGVHERYLQIASEQVVTKQLEELIEEVLGG